MAQDEHLFTSESVTEGHPDKIADQISDAVLDAILAQDPRGRVACETLLTTGLVVVAGEITTSCYVDIPELVRNTIKDIGYIDSALGFDCHTCGVIAAIDKQSPDIALGVDKEGAGDQGLMFGYACRETEELMPLPIMLAHRLVERLSQVRRKGTLDYLRPDGKSQVSVRYRDGKPVAVETIVVSTQHADHIGQDQIRNDIIEHVIRPVVPAGSSIPIGSSTTSTRPAASSSAGRWATPASPVARSSSTPTVAPARTAAAPSRARTRRRWIARRATWRATWPRTSSRPAWPSARRCRWPTPSVLPEPVSIMVKTDGNAKLTDRQLEDLVRRHFDFRPRAIIEYLNLRRPIFRKTAAFGHFGRNDPDFTWENTDRAKDLRKAAGI